MMDHSSNSEAKINQWGQPGSFVTKFLPLLPPDFMSVDDGCLYLDMKLSFLIKCYKMTVF